MKVEAGLCGLFHLKFRQMVVFVKLRRSKAFILKYAKLSDIERERINRDGIKSTTMDELTLVGCPINPGTLFLSRDFSSDYGGFYVDIFKRTYLDNTKYHYSTYSKVFTLTMSEEQIMPLGRSV